MKSLPLFASRLLIVGLSGLSLSSLRAQNSAPASGKTQSEVATPVAPKTPNVTAARVKYLAEKLGLEAEQQTKIRDILEDENRKLNELTSPAQRNGETVRALNRARDAAIEAVLSPQQQEKYRALVHATPQSQVSPVATRPSTGPRAAQFIPNNAAAVDGLKIELGTVQITSKANDGENNVSALLELNGAFFQTGKAYRIVVSEAKDGTGHPLSHDQANKGEFLTLNKLQSARPQSAGRTQAIGLRTKSEPKEIAKLTGHVEIVEPSRDPASVVAVEFTKHVGTPLKNPALVTAGVEIKFEPLRGGPTTEKPNEPWYLVYNFKDPNGKLVGEAEFFDSTGHPLSTSGFNGSGFPVSGAMRAAHFKAKPPEDVMVKFYLATEKSVVRVPFDFENVPVKQLQK